MQFEILEIPGHGAQATVCVAREVGRNEVICLKVLAADFGTGTDTAKRARDEARLLQRLDHPNIVAMRRSLEIDERIVMVMEWVKGEQLQRIVRKHGAIPVPLALAIIEKVASAALYAYELPESDGQPLRLVHRDLNLTNILLSGTGEVKVLDFGLARASFEDREVDTVITLRGTAGYSAPEGLTGDDGKIDVYSLGICLLYLITGHLPVLSKQKLSHDLRLSDVFTHMQDRGIGDGIYLELCALLRGMCAYHPDDRLDMAGVIQALAALGPDAAGLVEFSERHVRPLQEERSRLPAAEHPSYPELAFLESASSDDPKGDLRLRKLLREQRWFERESEVKWMLLSNPDWTGEPLLAYLDRAQRPWWQVWMPLPPREGVLAAMRLLQHRPETARRINKRLLKHKDAEIAELAAKLAASG